MLPLLLVTLLLNLVTSAPVLPDAAHRPLVRSKRSDEAIMYNTHRRFARQFPPPQEKLDHDPEDITLDKDPEMSQEENPEDTNNTTEEIQNPGGETQEEAEERIDKLLSSDLDQEKEAPVEEGQKEEKEEEQEAQLKAQEEAQEEGKKVEAEKEREEENMENVGEDMDLGDVKSEGLLIPDPAKVTEEYQIVDEPTSGNGENAVEETAKTGYQEYDWEPYFNEENIYGGDKSPRNTNFFKAYREKRNAAHKSGSRAARSAPQAVRAEDMSMMAVASSKLGGRVKRDLDFSSDDLEPYLDDGYYGDEDDYGVYPSFYPDDGMVMDRRADGPGAEWPETELDNYIQDPRYDVDPRSYDPPGYLLEDAPVMMEDIEPEERRKLAMLRYLYEQGLGAEDQEEDYPDDLEETWQDLGPARDVAFNPESFEAPEEQLPLPPRKRQYLSFVPGNRKRDSGMFYPAQYGPDGRWGAMVVDPEREKRNELAEYERLYELAQALNGPRDDEMEKRFDSYVPDPYDSYWDRFGIEGPEH